MWSWEEISTFGAKERMKEEAERVYEGSFYTYLNRQVALILVEERTTLATYAYQVRTDPS
jgi:hypothetical protein